MKTDPIKNAKMIRKIINNLKKEDKIRDLVLFEVGIYTALRIKTILELRVKNVNIKDKLISVKESKTGKYKRIELHDELYELLKEYIKHKPQNSYLIESRLGGKLSYSQAYRIMKDIAKVNKLKGNIACHSLRKSYSYHIYNDTGDITLIMDSLNHSSTRETLRYIGAIEKEVNRATKRLNFN